MLTTLRIQVHHWAHQLPFCDMVVPLRACYAQWLALMKLGYIFGFSSSSTF